MMLVAAISMLSMLGVLIVVLLDSTVQKSTWTQEQQRDTQVDNVAETAIALAAERIWSGFERAYGEDGMQPWNFRSYLDSLGLEDQSSYTLPQGEDFLADAGLSRDAEGNYPLAGGYVLSLEVLRLDEWDGSQLTISASASLSSDPQVGEGKRTVAMQEVFTIGRPEWEGLDFALLANNVNCILCHAEIDDAQRFYNRDPLARGTFDRVRVGSLESFHVRENPESKIAGTLYLGGDALREDGSRITDWGSFSLKSAAFDGQAKLIEDLVGQLTSTDLTPADTSTPRPLANLYLDYLNPGPGGQVDGELPDYFPSPFPDNGGFDPVTGDATPELGDNRVLDSNEFMAAAGAATGSISGGTVAVVPPGSRLDSLSDYDSALLSGTNTLSNLTHGNVVLHGTALNPIVIDGPIAVDGDVVLSGYVKGRGSIMASGNVFIPSDVQFLDGTDGSGARTYGTASDGTVNALGIASGGNITVGDPTHPALGVGPAVDGTPDTPFNFIMDELAIFNRGEWMKTQAELPGKAVYTMTGTRTVSVRITPTREELQWVDRDIYDWVPTGNTITEDVYGWVQTGTRTVDVYRTIHHPADPPAPYGSPWTERVWDGTREEPVYEWQVTGSRTRPEYIYDYIRTDRVQELVTVPDGDPYYEDQEREVWEWVTPMHPNPFYEGADYIARYYAMDEGTPVPIFNRKGYFDPDQAVWHSAERPENWTNGRLSLADPSDPADPYLFDSSGKPIAVISTVTPVGDWLSDKALADLVDRELGKRNDQEPVAIDATLYSGNSLFGIIPARGQDGVNGSLRVNGSLVAADIGLLAPNGIQVNYDSRNKDLLDLSDDRSLSMRRVLWAPAAP